MNTPDLPPMNLIALVQGVVQTTLALVAAMGFGLSEPLAGAIIAEATMLTTVLIYADLRLRQKRLEHLPELVQSKMLAPPAPSADDEPPKPSFRPTAPTTDLEG